MVIPSIAGLLGIFRSKTFKAALFYLFTVTSSWVDDDWIVIFAAANAAAI